MRALDNVTASELFLCEEGQEELSTKELIEQIILSHYQRTQGPGARYVCTWAE